MDLEGLIEAYFDCRKRKKRTASAVNYEMEYESNLIRLCERVNARTYAPGKNICFVISQPRYREVFAASFEDRIIHHWLALRLEPLFESVFSDRTFNCRKGKGQAYGVRMLREDIRKCSVDYTADCYVIKLDLQGFFMSIDKKMLADMLDGFIVERYKGGDVDDVRWLTRVVVMNCPEKNCVKKCAEEKWRHMPRNKSLFTCGEGKGIAIGNLFSQLFANFLLNGLDWFLLERFEYVGRYVDDFYIVDKDKGRLLDAVEDINSYLGVMTPCNEYNVRKRVLMGMNENAFRYAYIGRCFGVVIIRKRYKERERTYERWIKEG